MALQLCWHTLSIALALARQLLAALDREMALAQGSTAIFKTKLYINSSNLEIMIAVDYKMRNECRFIFLLS